MAQVPEVDPIQMIRGSVTRQVRDSQNTARRRVDRRVSRSAIALVTDFDTLTQSATVQVQDTGAIMRNVAGVTDATAVGRAFFLSYTRSGNIPILSGEVQI